MYFLVNVNMTVPVSPDELGKASDIDSLVLQKLRNDLELTVIDKNLGYIVAVLDAKPSELGKIVPGSPDIYFDTKVSLLVFRPIKNEIVEGRIEEITQNEVFINLGVIDARCTIQHISSDRVKYIRQQLKDGTTEVMLKAVRRKVVYKIGDIIRAKIIRFEYKMMVEIGPLMRGQTIAQPPTVIRPKSEIKIHLTARERGLGLLKELMNEWKEAGIISGEENE